MCGDGRTCVFCCKYVLVVGCCILHVLCGCALLGLGLYLCFEPSMRSYAQTSGNLQEYYIALYCLIGIGGLMMLVGFLGCCGACAESRILLGLVTSALGMVNGSAFVVLRQFFTFLLLICVVEVGGGFYAYTNKEELQKLVTESMTKTVKEVYGQDQVVTTAFDSMQQGLECCGANGVSDWVGSTYGRVPPSCCIDEVCEVPTIPAIISKIFGQGDVVIHIRGCAGELFTLLEQHTVILAGLTIGIGVVQLLGMVFSCCLCVAIGRQDREKEYI